MLEGIGHFHQVVLHHLVVAGLGEHHFEHDALEPRLGPKFLQQVVDTLDRLVGVRASSLSSPDAKYGHKVISLDVNVHSRLKVEVAVAREHHQLVAGLED